MKSEKTDNEHFQLKDVTATIQRLQGHIDKRNKYCRINDVEDDSNLVIIDGPKNPLVLNSSFRSMLEPRDRDLQHKFSFQVNITQPELQKLKNRQVQIFQCPFYLKLIEQIRVFLLEAISNVISIAFNHLLKDELQGTESKQYAAKNILLNVQTLYRQTINSIENHKVLKDHLEQDHLMTLRMKVCIEIDHILNNITQNLGDGYPEAPVVGGTLRMKEALKEVNRLNCEQNDFIFANNIKISKFIPKEEQNASGRDFTQFIMTVLNTAIEAIQSKIQDKKERTIREEFTYFNEQLFWLSSKKNYDSIVKEITSRQKEIKQKQLIQHQFKDETLKGNSSLSIIDFTVASAEQIQQMKKDLKYSIGQKIPSSVQPFTKRQITNNQFMVQHSSVMRVLTKWAGYLEQIFENHEEYIQQRYYPFKTIDNMQVELDKENKKKLSDALGKQYTIVKQKFQILLRNSYSFISDFLKEDRPKSSNVLRYAQSKVLSSKISTALASLIVKYISILIDHLLKAGQSLATKDGHKKANISLVVFRVGDLMRSKLQCQQTNFINILKAVYFMDNHEQMKQKFKLVRIKNKLNQSANNIIINYLFMGKIQCELQLSIQEPKTREKKYHTFSHFIYELGRGRFGVLAQCAVMVAQIDPMVASGDRKNGYYTQRASKAAFVNLKQQFSHNNVKKLNRQVSSLVFTCPQCKRHRINQKNDMFVIKEHEGVCNQCIIKANDIFVEGEIAHIEDKLTNTKLRQILISRFLKRIRSYEYCDDQNQRYILKINKKGQISFNLVLFIRKQLKTFFVRIDPTIIKLLKQTDIDFKDVQYCNITDKIKRAKKDNLVSEDLLYLVEQQTIIPSICQLIGIDYKQFIDNQSKVEEVFRQFRQQKFQIKRIKFKAEIIHRNKFPHKWQILDRAIRILALNQQQEHQYLKYRQYCTLGLSNIKVVQANQVCMSNFPKWIQKCTTLKSLEFADNNLTTVNSKQLPQKLHFIDLCNNNISYLDVSHLTQLKKLKLQKNQVQNIKFGSISTITHLKLKENLLTKIDLKNMHNLEHLDLQLNFIESIEIKNLNKLESINLSKNNLDQVIISNLIKLQQLTLNNNKKQLKKIQIVGLEELASLTLCNNKLSEVLLVQLPNLTDLDLSNNQLWDSSALHLYTLTQLKDLRLNGNNFNHIDVGSLSKLKQLYVNGNKLTQLRLQKNTQLSTVNMTENKIEGEIDFRNNEKLENLEVNQNTKMTINSLPQSNVLTFLKIDLEVFEKYISKWESYQLEGLKNIETIQIMNGRTELSTRKLKQLGINPNVTIISQK